MSTEYLKFDANSIKELLKQKLNELETYTEHRYPASDTSLLIDLFSWTFNVMNYILNQNAAEVLFADSTSYENMNRLSKLLSYKPKAYRPATAEFSIGGNFGEDVNGTLKIPRFTTIMNANIDSSGNQICYSFMEDYVIQIVNGKPVVPKNNPVLSNGKFTYYEFENAATGSEFETFIMAAIDPDDGINIGEGSLHVYVTKADENTGIESTTEYTEVYSLISDATQNDRVFEARLDENKEYMIKFGDGIHGKKLEKGAKVSVVYLKVNTSNSALTTGIKITGMKLDIDNMSNISDIVNKCFGSEMLFIKTYDIAFANDDSIVSQNSNITFTVVGNSSEEKNYEDVNDIREFAPLSFRLGNRLVTASDYRTYILNNFSTRIKDVYVCNNNEYCTTFYKWLDSYDMFTANIRLNNYEYADACDFNNIYVWLEPNENAVINSSFKNSMIQQITKMKTMTSNIVICNAVKTYYTPFILPRNSEGEYDFTVSSLSVETFPAKIQLKRLKSYISNEKIISNVAEVIVDYFEEREYLNAEINAFDLQQKIMQLGYIESIRTVCKHPDYIENGVYTSYINGLAFAKFTPNLVDNLDFDIVTTFEKSQKFQYPVLLDKGSIEKMIEIADEHTYTLLKDNF